ncbi:MAG: hydantoinase B/oxoprolinase family protein [Candidatus Rokubacteria bacterium]|nr:hydantoinase B/oxoprolinase family protein [Candidatus Rokubacteria bacterium]
MGGRGAERLDENLGWQGRSAREMLLESERRFRESGRYWGLETLAFQRDDPIRYEKMYAKLRGALVSARETALHVTSSPIVRELGELCFALYTPEGDSVVLSTGIMVHVHTMSDAIKWMVRQDYERDPGIRPGDIFCNNDSFIGNVHASDIQTLVPLFDDGELLGWVGGVTHVTDVGGTNPGSAAPTAVSRYDDGLIICAEKIGEEDRLYRHYQIRCERSVRTPDLWRLDERARLAGCHIVRAAVERLIADEGAAAYKRFVREVIEEGRRAFQARVRERLVPGRYRAPSFMAIHYRGAPVPLAAARDSLLHAPLEIVIDEEGGLSLDLDGANAWGLFPYNATPTAMQGGLFVMLSQTLAYDGKVNDGFYLATRHHWPPGTLCNPGDLRAATGMAWAFLTTTFQGFFGLVSRGYFARGFVEEILAGYPSAVDVMKGEGRGMRGEPTAVACFEHASYGLGARAIGDGLDTAYAMFNPEADMGDVETWELGEPLLYLGRRIKPNTAGAGRHRGGSGFESLRMLWGADDFRLQCIGGGKIFGRAGLFGGYPGGTGYKLRVHRTDLRERFSRQEPYPSADGDAEHSEVERLVAGEVVRSETSTMFPEPFGEGDLYLNIQGGGPGYGDPLERDPAAVVADLDGGYFVPRTGESLFGVRAARGPDGAWVLDDEGTRRLREELRHRRLERAVPVSEWWARERQRLLEGRLAEPVARMYRESLSLGPRWARQFEQFWQLPEGWRPGGQAR